MALHPDTKWETFLKPANSRRKRAIDGLLDLKNLEMERDRNIKRAFGRLTGGLGCLDLDRLVREDRDSIKGMNKELPAGENYDEDTASESDDEDTENETEVEDPKSMSRSKGKRNKKERPTTIRIKNKDVHIVDFLGGWWWGWINDLHNVDRHWDPTLLPDCEYDLSKWQEIGALKLDKLMNSPLRGGMLCDDTGLGKTITSLLAALKYHIDNPGFGPILVVTKIVLMSQWEGEAKKLRKADNQPLRCLIVSTENKHVDIELILQQDIIITSYDCFKNTYSDSKKAENFCFEAHWSGLNEARRLYGNRVETCRPAVPFHAKTYKKIGKQFCTVIFDESHEIKNRDTLASKAARALPCKTVINVTATPMANRWSDFIAQILVLPGCPLVDFEHSVGLFTTDASTSTQRDPDGPEFNLFVLLAMGITVARPKIVLGLRELRIVEKPTKLDVELQYAVIGLMKHFRQVSVIPSSDPNDKGKSVGFAQLAQLFTFNKKLGEYSMRESDKDFDWWRQFGLYHFRLRHGENRNIDEVSTNNLRTFFDDYVITPKGPRHTDNPFSEWLEVQKVIFQAIETENDGRDREDDEDKSDNEAEDMEMYLEEKEAEAVMDQQFSKEVKSWSIEDLKSPKVVTIMNTLLSISERAPGSKTLVFSHFLRALDILEECMDRENFKFKPMRFDGRLKKSEQRDRVLQEFKNSPDRPLLFLTTGAGGVGLNITEATNVVFCEPFWNKALQRQATDRCYRLGQKEQVTVYIIKDDLSAVDFMKDKGSMRKAKPVDRVMHFIVRGDDEPAIQLELPSKEDMGPPTIKDVMKEPDFQPDDESDTDELIRGGRTRSLLDSDSDAEGGDDNDPQGRDHAEHDDGVFAVVEIG